MIFPHKDRFFTLNMSDFLINGLSHGKLRVSWATAGEPDFLQILLPGKRGGQMDSYFTRQLSYPGSDFNDFQPDGVKLG